MDSGCRRAGFRGALWASFALLGGIFCPAWSRCPKCDFLLGMGTTFVSSRWTDGITASFALELDESRWEVGAFRFANSQYLESPLYPPSTISAHPYWGFSLMRRLQLLHRGRWRLYLGFGAAYKTETDLLDATRWNFAYVLAIRHPVGDNAFLELSLRHWSNAWIREPNRGQDLLSLSVGFR